MYTEHNFKTKKQLREAVAAGKQVRCYQPRETMMKHTAILNRERECKHSWRYVEEGDSPVFGVLYISKQNFLAQADFPLELKITLETEE
jgi:hypothetical protein